jgi:hypothetical protein
MNFFGMNASAALCAHCVQQQAGTKAANRKWRLSYCKAWWAHQGSNLGPAD